MKKKIKVENATVVWNDIRSEIEIHENGNVCGKILLDNTCPGYEIELSNGKTLDGEMIESFGGSYDDDDLTQEEEKAINEFYEKNSDEDEQNDMDEFERNFAYDEFMNFVGDKFIYKKLENDMLIYIICKKRHDEKKLGELINDPEHGLYTKTIDDYTMASCVFDRDDLGGDVNWDGKEKYKNCKRVAFFKGDLDYLPIDADDID